MKKFRKILAALSAVTVCAVSLSPLVSNAKVGGWIYAPDNTVTPYTTSFTVNGNEKYTLWQEATDYFGNKDFKVYISKGIDSYGEEFYGVMGSLHQTYYAVALDKMVDRCEVCPLYIDQYYDLKTEEDKEKLVGYLSENNIPYEADGNTVSVINPDKEATIYDDMQMYIDIKENTGFVLGWGLLESVVEIESAESTFPEKTLDGDANEDGAVNMADVAAIIQHIGNKDKYGLTMQGIVNADSDGDGLTGADAIEIQMKVAEAGMPE